MKLLYLVHRLPYPPNKGDKVRSYHLLKHLAARHEVHLGTFIDDPDDEQHLPRVRELCAGLHAARLNPRTAGRLINQLRDVATMVGDLPAVTLSADPHDNYLLALAQAGRADFLLTGDKRDLLALRNHQSTRILTVRDFLEMHRRLP